jgi:DNA-binding MarR family transcriptional regulator
MAEYEEYDKKRISGSIYRFLESLYFLEKQEEEKFGLTRDEIYLLQIISSNPGMRVTDLANRMKIEVFSISRMLSKMEDLELVQRANSMKDKRSYTFDITERGTNTISDIEAYSNVILVSRLEVIPREELAIILSILDDFGTILNRPN